MKHPSTFGAYFQKEKCFVTNLRRKYERKLCLKFQFFRSKSNFFPFRHKFTIISNCNRQTIKIAPEMSK